MVKKAIRYDAMDSIVFYLDFQIILFAHENLAFCVRDILWGAKRGILAVVTLQQGFPTQLSTQRMRTTRCYIFMCGEYTIHFSY
jgi:hypothetical protein